MVWSLTFHWTIYEWSVDNCYNALVMYHWWVPLIFLHGWCASLAAQAIHGAAQGRLPIPHHILNLRTVEYEQQILADALLSSITDSLNLHLNIGQKFQINQSSIYLLLEKYAVQSSQLSFRSPSHFLRQVRTFSLSFLTNRDSHDSSYLLGGDRTVSSFRTRRDITPDASITFGLVVTAGSGKPGVPSKTGSTGDHDTARSSDGDTTVVSTKCDINRPSHLQVLRC